MIRGMWIQMRIFVFKSRDGTYWALNSSWIMDGDIRVRDGKLVDCFSSEGRAILKLDSVSTSSTAAPPVHV